MSKALIAAVCAAAAIAGTAALLICMAQPYREAECEEEPNARIASFVPSGCR